MRVINYIAYFFLVFLDNYLRTLAVLVVPFVILAVITYTTTMFIAFSAHDYIYLPVVDTREKMRKKIDGC